MNRADRRVACLATVPERRDILPEVLQSLDRQVDDICVYLNGHEDVPDCVHDHRCSYSCSFVSGDRGDAGKFYWGSHFGAEPIWLFTCDDDFHYIPGYAPTLVDAAIRLEAAVSLHGIVLVPEIAQGEEVSWLREARQERYGTQHATEADVPVHILGTGVACTHTSLVRLKPEDFPHPNSADIYYSAKLQRERVRRFVPENGGHLARQISPPLDHGPKDLRWSGEYSRRVAQFAPWALHTDTEDS